MDNIKFHYSSKTGKVTSADVYLDGELIVISQGFISELEKYACISDYDDEMFAILARAVELRAENSKKIQHCVRKYKLGSSVTDFAHMLIPRLLELKQLVSINVIAAYFEEAKIEDLDLFINRMNIYDFARMLFGACNYDEC